MQPDDIAHKLDTLRASMQTLSSTIEATEREYTEALRRESTRSVTEVLASLEYATQDTAAIVCSGPFGSFTIPGREYDIGCATMDRKNKHETRSIQRVHVISQTLCCTKRGNLTKSQAVKT